MNTDTLAPLLNFLKIRLIILDDNVDKECQNFSHSKISAYESCLAFA